MIELKRSINNKSFLFYLLEIVLSFSLGYFLLVGIDKIHDVNITQFQFSTYTVITQFGMMIYSIVVINSINQDYREKNILFLKKNQVDPSIYLIKKVFVSVLWFTIFTTLIHVLISFFYNNFDTFFIMLFYSLNAIYYTIFISAICGFLFKNILVAYGVNLLIWISSIVFVAIFPNMKFIGYFDASNQLYKNLETFLETGNTAILSIPETFIYNILILLFIICISHFLSKRWLKNGI